MSLASIINALLFLLYFAQAAPIAQPSNHFSRGKFSEKQTEVLLYRLDHSHGNQRQLNFLKMVLLSHNPVDACRDKGDCVTQIINTVEQISLIYSLRQQNYSRLQHARHYTRQLQASDDLFREELESLPRTLRFLYGDSMSSSISSYLGHQMKKLNVLKRQALLADTDELTWTAVAETAASCFASIQSGLKTFRLLSGNFEVADEIMSKLASWFNMSRGTGLIKRVAEDKVGKGTFPLRTSGEDSPPPKDIQGDMKFLRDSLSVTLRAGMFMILCIQMQIYACTFIFGALVSISSFIWITVYLDMVSNSI